MSSFALIPRRLRLESTTLFVCDVQERFRSVIHRFPSILNRCSLLNECSKLLSIPTICTEQYSRVFGKTVPEINLDPSTFVFEKKKFSMMTDEVQATFSGLNKNQVLLCGIEAHVCVLQTGLDLIAGGTEVFIVCDAVSSQRQHDRAVALSRLESAGAVLTTTESALFDLLGGADHPQFKVISGLLKASNEGVNEFSDDVTP